jgi:hypothetical protein
LQFKLIYTKSLQVGAAKMESADDPLHLAELLEAAHREALDVLENVDHSSVIYEEEGWTVKDIIGNFVAWEAEGLAAIRAYEIGDEYHPDTSFENVYEDPEDDIAARLYAAWESVGELLRAAIVEIPEDRRLMLVRCPWGEYGHVDKLVGELIAYQRVHLNAIVESLNKRAS